MKKKLSVMLLMFVLMLFVSCKKDSNDPTPVPVNYKVKSMSYTDSGGNSGIVNFTYNSDGLISKVSKSETFNGNNLVTNTSYVWTSDKVTYTNDNGETNFGFRNPSGYVVSMDSGKTIYTYNAENQLIKFAFTSEDGTWTDTNTCTWFDGNINKVVYSNNQNLQYYNYVYTYGEDNNTLDFGDKYLFNISPLNFIKCKKLPTIMSVTSSSFSSTSNFSYGKDSNGRINKLTEISGSQVTNYTFNYFN